jgi:hypothetical protein
MFPSCDPFLMYKVMKFIGPQDRSIGIESVSEISIIANFAGSQSRGKIHSCIDHLLGFGWVQRPSHHLFTNRSQYITTINDKLIP